MLKKRYLTPYIVNDLKEKMVFVGGPRQVGKTTLFVVHTERHGKTRIISARRATRQEKKIYEDG